VILPTHRRTVAMLGSGGSDLVGWVILRRDVRVRVCVCGCCFFCVFWFVVFLPTASIFHPCTQETVQVPDGNPCPPPPSKLSRWLTPTAAAIVSLHDKGPLSGALVVGIQWDGAGRAYGVGGAGRGAAGVGVRSSHLQRLRRAGSYHPSFTHAYCV